MLRIFQEKCEKETHLQVSPIDYHLWTHKNRLKFQWKSEKCHDKKNLNPKVRETKFRDVDFCVISRRFTDFSSSTSLNLMKLINSSRLVCVLGFLKQMRKNVLIFTRINHFHAIKGLHGLFLSLSDPFCFMVPSSKLKNWFFLDPSWTTTTIIAINMGRRLELMCNVWYRTAWKQEECPTKATEDLEDNWKLSWAGGRNFFIRRRPEKGEEGNLSKSFCPRREPPSRAITI